MAKKYSTAHVNNPTSMQHLVLLHPGQDLMLSLPKGPKRSIVEISGNLLHIDGVAVKPEREEYHILPKEDYSLWSQYSSCLLGEVWIDSHNSLSKLVVIQDCRNKEKKNHITVVNPDCYDVRVHPHNIIEVILYDLDFSYQDEWSWRWSPFENLDLEMLGHDVLSLFYLQHQDDPSMQYAMCPRVDTDEICRQHHMWFRFGKEIMSQIKKNHDVTHVGNLSFEGRENKFIPSTGHKQMNLSLYVDFRKTKVGRLIETMDHKPKATYDSANPKKFKKTSFVPVKKKTLPTIKEVSITKVNDEDLHQGCKVLSAMPTSSATQMMYEDYDDFAIAPNKHWYEKSTYWKKRWD